ncbi:hypothetical protein FVEG_13733 [Fusarium verticillioides 7600]|uniref:Heterokaryon incompatibility domain-containing protein n=1 Tax=Gibberella moniliformis (strain M3125 / FGSC 7600) TaxID=334819 RepID=W7N7Q4_GIBM7|nr:hypothetical protein FVEG_13733 [Fusarium verticillioides 7600]EWG55784.1 hypothetical protein FVEG_13733 [Fusarium verticillioides 7600]
MNLGMCHPDLRAMASSVGRKGSKGLYPHVKWNYVSMLFSEEFWNMGNDLFELLSSTKHCYATNPRDKIFALIGLAGDKTFGIRPNYNKTKSVVFTEFALNVISETRNLKVLNYSDVEDPNDEERLPLWAPRWQHEATPGYCDMSLFGFKSSNGLELNLESSINTQVLPLNGLYVDQVKESYAQDIKPDLNCMAIGSMVTNQRRLLKHQYGLDMIRAIALTMIKGRTLLLYADTECKRPTDDSYLNAFTAFAFRSFVASFVKIDDGERYQKAILQLIKMAIDARPPISQNDPDWDRPGLRKFVNDKLAHLHPDSMETVSSYMEVLGRMPCDIEDFLTFAQDFGYSCHRKFFITGKGYIGTGPRSLEPGDFVCILFGGDTPYIVRQRPSASDEYLFLGTTYVHGIMEGEAITTWQEQKDSQDPKFQERLFKLI